MAETLRDTVVAVRRVLTLLVAASAMASTASAAAPGPLDPSQVRLPAEGLVLQQPHGVLLVGLDGRTIGTLTGFRLAGTRNDVIDQLVARAAGATYLQSPSPILVGPGRQAWQLTAGRLRRLPPRTLPLAGGVTVVGRLPKGSPGLVPQVAATVRDRTGRVLIGPADRKWFVVRGRLLADRGKVTDLATGERWRHPAGVTWNQGVGADACTPAGVRAGRLVAVCQRVGKQRADGTNSAVRAFAVSRSGARTTLSGTLRYESFGAMSAFASPNGAYVAATLAVGCGLSPSVVLPTPGRSPRFLRGGPAYVLGWADGRIVAQFAHGECTDITGPEIDLVDPATLARTRIVRLGRSTAGWELWS